MRIIALATLALAIGAATAGAQTLGELTAATGVNNTLDANATNNAMKSRDTILRHLGPLQAPASGTGKGGWEEADAGHGGGHEAANSGKAWVSGHSGSGGTHSASTGGGAWARGGTPSGPNRKR
jgi:hypothetical protein